MSEHTWSTSLPSHSYASNVQGKVNILLLSNVSSRKSPYGSEHRDGSWPQGHGHLACDPCRVRLIVALVCSIPGERDSTVYQLTADLDLKWLPLKALQIHNPGLPHQVPVIPTVEHELFFEVTRHFGFEKAGSSRISVISESQAEICL